MSADDELPPLEPATTATAPAPSAGGGLPGFRDLRTPPGLLPPSPADPVAPMQIEGAVRPDPPGAARRRRT